ncbi:MAG: hypothetical protein HUU30_03990 [Burkholderiaceae bacterium]|nr:hypothetical protein [Burkholderiaceae bacterium]
MKNVNDARRTWLKLGITATAMMGTLGRDACAQGAAGGARPTVLLSLVADELVMVGERPSIGSNLNKNLRSAMPLSAGAVDAAIGKLMKAELARALPQVQSTVINTPDPALYKGHDSWFDLAGARATEEIVADLRGTGAGEALLLLKHRADAAIQAANGLFGTGQLEGLGYYMNQTDKSEYKGDAVADGRGWIAPYAYLRLVRLNLADGRVMAQRRVKAAYLVGDKRTEGDTGPWKNIPDDQKLVVLLDLVQEQLQEHLPALYATP